jgi:hypothetical protein
MLIKRNNHYLNPWMVLLAFVVLFGSIFLASGADPRTGRWYSLGGVMMDGYYPSLSSSGGEYVVGSDGSLWAYFDSGSSPVWNNLGGKVTSSPCVVRDLADWDHVFVRGADGHLWDRRVDKFHRTGDDIPGDWIDLGGYIKEGTSPAAELDNTNIIIRVHGNDDGLWGKMIQATCQWDSTFVPHGLLENSPPLQGDWVSLGGKIVGSPSVRQDFTAVRGSDNALWVNKWINPSGSTSSWYSLGGILAGDPSIGIPLTGGDFLIYVKGADGALWVNDFKEIPITGVWTGLGGQISGTDSPAPCISYLDNSRHAFVKGTDNAVWDCVLPGGIWYNLGGQITSKPQTYVSLSRSDIFARGSDGALWEYL